MARLVMKFGGTSVADLDHIRNVARHVKREVDAGNDVAVVVSAMAGSTNQLVAWCQQAAALHDAREYDAVVASGEQVTAGLLAIVLEDMGVDARSWQGWQLPILTDNAHGAARIVDVNGAELIKRFKERHQVAVITGFQGLHKDTGRITTLGRGGRRDRRRDWRCALRHLHRRRRHLHHRPARGGACAPARQDRLRGNA
jgi:aspartate kinase